MARQTDNRKCLWCEQPIRGRADKKYCDDNCRNAFNNQRQEGEYNLVRNINRTLIRNRRILATVMQQAGSETCISKDILLQMGFQFKYFTQAFTSADGQVCHCCYDYGYLRLPEEGFLVIKKIENILTARLTGR
ncbi:hypothetical protein ACFSQD_17500 [Flavihumibacter stibioxidans]|uniref:DUF2116 family Zn-ribbon domain-containing protein n=1 Tax=Flavihumibacter stibioxidans TaxID=1834163 RepID=A0ABR7MCM2_9BACT|nr:hypothetical protein [Flavihumibacter stibioxidans]MBC6492781.1 hypothetical protein [Flavihumibacter stibioxidans]